MMKQAFCIYFVDIVGTCNLRCPSCPVGNYQDTDFISSPRPKGFMELALFEDILDKIKQESRHYEHIIISVYNWGEPLLHPKLPQFIEAIRARGFISEISTNLNVKNIKAVVTASPNKLIISLSGYDNHIYSQTHKKGHSHLVISNLYKLRYYMDTLKTVFPVEVSYHLYKHNIGKDAERIRSISHDLGFRFVSDFTFLMPLEKNLKYLNGGKLSPQDEELISLMLIKPEEQVVLAQPDKEIDCSLRDLNVINFDGTTALCCAVYDYQYNVADNFLTVSQAELEERKRTHPLCQTCMDKGLHVIATAAPRAKLDKLINERLKALGSKIQRDDSHLRNYSFDYI